MWLIRFIFHYIIIPVLCSLLAILAGLLLANVLPEILQQRGLTGANKDLIGIAASAFIAAIIATFVQRIFVFMYRAGRGKDYKEDSPKELV